MFFYLLRKFYINFIYLFITLLVVFSAVDLILRLPAIGSIAFIPQIFIYMIPLVSVFVIPIAAALAVQNVTGNFYQNNSALVFGSLANLRKKFFAAILFFSCSLLLPYLPLVFDFAPKCYEHGKKLFVAFAKEHISLLEEDRFHYVTPELTLFFKGKKNLPQSTLLYDLFAVFNDAGSRYIISAQEGEIFSDTLNLKNGSIQVETSQGQNYVASFSTTSIGLQKLVDGGVFAINGESEVQPRFLSWKDLSKEKYSSDKLFIEFHSRIGKVLWLLLLPLISFFLFIWFARLDSTNLVVSICATTFVVLVYYFIFGFAQALWHKPIYSLFLIYIVSLLFLIFSKDLSRRGARCF